MTLLRRLPSGVLLALALGAGAPAVCAAPRDWGKRVAPGQVRQQEQSVERSGNVSLQFESIEVRAALQLLAKLSHTSIVVSDSVVGTMSLALHEVPWQEALTSIVQARGLAQRQSGRIIWVVPEREIMERERQQALAQTEQEQARDQSGRLVTRSFRLSHARAVDLERQLLAQAHSTVAANALQPVRRAEFGTSGARLGGSGWPSQQPSAQDTAAEPLPFTPALPRAHTPLVAPLAFAALRREVAPVWANAQTGRARQHSRLLSSRGSVLADARSNQLVVTDTEARLETLSEVIQLLDRPMKQVQIEARIVEADSSWGRNLGLRLGALQTRQDGAGRTRTLGGGLENHTLFDGHANDLGGVSAAALAFSIVHPALSQLLNVEISTLEASGEGHLVASPRIVTADQQKAVIEQGTELPYQLRDKEGNAQLQFRRALLRLEVTPRITPDGTIVLDLLINRDTVGRNTAAGLAIDTKHVQSQVMVENGGTIAIGGIFETAEHDELSKVPLLGDIPLLGALFRRTQKSREKNELHVFVTPRLIDSQGVLY